MESAIYVGKLRHRRFRPVRHEFTYPLFMVFLDIDRLPELMRISPLASYNRWNWASFQERDHFGDASKRLRERMRQQGIARGITLPEGKIFLLTHLRYLGYNFNPVSFFYCHDRDQKLQMVLAEVNNTFGESENYWLTEASERPCGGGKKYAFQKTFHVSPFMRLGQAYEWTFTDPADRLVTECISRDGGEVVFDSTLGMDRREWSAAELHRALIRFPAMTLKVIAAIHWQALRLILKRVPIVSHPGPGHFSRSETQHWGASWRTD